MTYRRIRLASHRRRYIERDQHIHQPFRELYIITDGYGHSITVTPSKEERFGGRVEQTMQSVRGKTQSNR
jgi:hypothetical protein